MLVVCKDKQGRIIAYTEYQIVNKFGHPCEVGQYCWISDTFVHPDYESKGLLKYMFQKRRYKYPIVKWVYFKREKYKGRMRIYSVEKFLK